MSASKEASGSSTLPARGEEETAASSSEAEMSARGAWGGRQLHDRANSMDKERGTRCLPDRMGWHEPYDERCMAEHSCQSPVDS